MMKINCGEGEKDGKWSPLGSMVRLIRVTPAHLSSGLFGFHVSVRPASDSTRWSGSNALMLSNWHWLSLSNSERVAKQLVKRNKEKVSKDRKGLDIVTVIIN